MLYVSCLGLTQGRNVLTCAAGAEVTVTPSVVCPLSSKRVAAGRRAGEGTHSWLLSVAQ